MTKCNHKHHCHEQEQRHDSHVHSCSCQCRGAHEEHHHHHHGHESLRGRLMKIIVAAVLLFVAYMVEKYAELSNLQLLLVYLVPYLLIGWDTLHAAVDGIIERDPFDENLLMSVATIGALSIGFLPGVSEDQYLEAVFVMLFFQVGTLFEGYAEGKSRDSISKMMDLRPDTANVERNGNIEVVAPDSVEIGEIVIIKPGEKVPIDGIVTEGISSLNTVALTGESMPRDVNVGEEVISGCININGLLKVRVTKSFGESTASKILDLVENAGASKSKGETFISKFARIYTPIVVFLAIALAFIPPFFEPAGYGASFAAWLYRALTFLVVSCPCALVISIPLTFFAGIGGASRAGILVKGGNYLDVLAKVGTVVFDKTGTLTKGIFVVNAVHPDNLEENELLHLVAHVEKHSTHPIAMALRHAYPNVDDGCKVENVEEIAGHGIHALVNGKKVSVGNEKMMQSVGAAFFVCEQCADYAGSVVHVAIEGIYAGHIVISDQIKEDAKDAVATLKKLDVVQTVMLTGDHKNVGENVAKQLCLDRYFAELLPADKVAHVETLLAERTKGKKLAFVGDGINDAPVLALADVGIAMGALGSDAAIEAADVVLMDDKPLKIAHAIKIARHTIAIAMQNAWFAIGIKVLILIFVALGVLGSYAMPIAVFGDVGVMVLCVLNAMRALRV